jgi:hypothetical protein
MTILWGWPHFKVACCEVIFLESILGWYKLCFSFRIVVASAQHDGCSSALLAFEGASCLYNSVVWVCFWILSESTFIWSFDPSVFNINLQTLSCIIIVYVQINVWFYVCSQIKEYSWVLGYWIFVRKLGFYGFWRTQPILSDLSTISLIIEFHKVITLVLSRTLIKGDNWQVEFFLWYPSLQSGLGVVKHAQMVHKAAEWRIEGLNIATSDMQQSKKSSCN